MCFSDHAPSRARGFTLIELLAVLAILALLASIVIGSGQRAVESGREAQARAELTALGAALEEYRRLYGDYPRTEDGARLLQSLLGRLQPDGAAGDGPAPTTFELAKWRVAGVDQSGVLIDPWGHPYRYAYRSALPWQNPRFVLFSAGPDGRVAAGWSRGGFPDRSAAEDADNLYSGESR